MMLSGRIVFLFAFLFSKNAFTLPASARLFQAVYAYKTSCMLCHADGGGSAPNSYGKAYLRAGANMAAFKKIETKDSDEDGIPNLKEILAKSNPGKRESTPQSPGDWLANIASIYIPEKELAELFSNVASLKDLKKFSAIEGSLSEAQLLILKEKTGHDSIDDDKVPTFYFAEKDGKKVAVAQLITAKSGDVTMTGAVAVSTSGKILATQIFKKSKATSDLDKFSLGLIDKDLKLISQLTTSNESEKVLLGAAMRSLVLMNIVFGGVK